VSVLAIKHVAKSSPPAFVVERQDDGKSCPPVPIPSPNDEPVEDQPHSDLMEQLRWYLEEFLDYPFPPDTLRAEHVQAALRAWGTKAFHALFDRRDAPAWLEQSEILQVRSDDAHILSWPWEALFDPRANYVAHRRRIERRLNEISDPPKLATLPDDRVNILLVVARPYDVDVRYRSIARPLVELIRDRHLPAHVDVLRPPTFDQLREQLRARPGYYHVVHFDGHGAFADGAGQYAPHQYQGPVGRLVFEDDQGGRDPKSASDLSTLLQECTVPVVVLNACQSGMLSDKAEDPFASVATALLQSGMRSVVAMAYSLYVSGAQVFLPAFYRRLFEAGDTSEAVRAGRQEMLAHKERVCVRGRFPLEDWILPVLYQQDPLDFGFAKQAKPEERQSRLPQEVLEYRDPYGFVGRDSALLAMERAIRRKAPAILVEGLGGVGKTTLARGFLRWLDETGGLDGALWFDFRDIRTAEYVINQTGEAFYGENFRLKPDKIALLGKALKEHRVLMVWDNFESAAVNLTSEDRAELGRLLDGIRDTKGKVIVTSRSREECLGPSLRSELRLAGLDGEERWEYCETILHELGLKVNRDDAGLKELMDQLAGHPLAMRVILPKLEGMTAAQILAVMRRGIAELGLDEKEEQGKLFGALHFVEQNLAQEFRPLLWPLGLHEGYVDGDFLKMMAEQVDDAWTQERIDGFLMALGAAGLLRDQGERVHEMHPLLTSYLRARGEAPEEWQRSFVDVMGGLATALTPKDLHEQRIPFFLNGANLHLALELAGRWQMSADMAALTQALALFAQRSSRWKEAKQLFERLLERSIRANNSKAEAAACHQLGRIAEEQRDFGTAEDWYLKSLAINEKDGNLPDAATTYRQLSRIATEQREFGTAREWCLKSLAITEKLGNQQVAVVTYYQLGRIAEEERDFGTAREWYVKSLEISEKLGIEEASASACHQLGIIAHAEGDLGKAQAWYLRSLEIKEKQGNLQGAASTYHQLGAIAQAEGDFDKARKWYLRSLDIKEREGNLHGAALTWGQLGILAGLEERYKASAEWLIRSIVAFRQTNDLHNAEQTTRVLMISYGRASPAIQQTIEASWQAAGLGEFPK
jgi:tetratricopeptide (TPR) repeat protein